MSLQRIKILIIALFVSISLNLSIFLPVFRNDVSALAGSEFQAGRIIDDGVFFDGNTMSIQQIQTFLNAKTPVCDTNGTKIYSGTTTRAQYGASVGNPAPYTCLKNYSQTTTTKPIESGLCNGHTSGKKSSAQIIYEVAKSCGISPKVLIVLLQKEQSLITDDWPWWIQYRSATGYGCPDTAPCDAQYYGFFNQVYAAARQFKYYAKYPTAFSYRSARNNYVLYNPNSSCGGSSVYIQNQATAGLYIYTPYRPNQAALNNLYGSGDSCSAYGNRNFWRLYNDWFGSTLSPDYSWSFVSQEVFADSKKAIRANLFNTVVGGRYYVKLTVKNSGNRTWSKGNTNIGTWSPENGVSAFQDNTWKSYNRPSSLIEDSVSPGKFGTFEFWVKAPTNPGVHTERFNLVVEGVSWMNDIGMYVSMKTSAFKLGWEHSSQAIYTDSSKSTVMNPNSLSRNTRYYAVIRGKNIGNTPWWKEMTNLGTSSPKDRNSLFYDPSWITQNRPAQLVQTSVYPGHTGSFEFWIDTPSTSGTYTEYYNPLLEGVSWMNDIGLHYKITL